VVAATAVIDVTAAAVALLIAVKALLMAAVALLIAVKALLMAAVALLMAAVALGRIMPAMEMILLIDTIFFKNSYFSLKNSGWRNN
jgi:hypothetical protein